MSRLLPSATYIGPVALRVQDLERSQNFYSSMLGLTVLPSETNRATMGDSNGTPLIHLTDDAHASPKPPGTTGVFHFAILVPDRVTLGQSAFRLGKAGGHLDGAADHLVSEALYLSDPDGIGIEIYRDRPRDEWSWRRGEVEMATLALDFQSLVEEYNASGLETSTPLSSATMGHIHLSVPDLTAAEEFYCGKLGFEKVSRYPQAIFVSAGRYHHHIGLNTWARRPPPPSSAGMTWFTIVLPTQEDVESAAAAVGSDGPDFTDPFGNGIRLVAG
jgi:catechol 2,3-dioxygenase